MSEGEIVETTQRVCDRCGAVLMVECGEKRDYVDWVQVTSEVHYMPALGEGRLKLAKQDLCIACAEADPAIKDVLHALRNPPEV